MAKPIPSGVSPSLLLSNESVLMPISSPSELTSAPPELPWLIDASVCRKFCRPDGFRPIRPVALIIPWVMVCPRLYGLPIASTTSPMCGVRLRLIGMVGRPPVALIFSTARSVRLSEPTSRASNTRPSCNATIIWSASLITCLLVIM